MQDLLPAPGAVDLRRLVQIGRNRRDAREEGDGAPPDVAPNVGDGEDRAPILGRGVPLDRIQPDRLQKAVQKPVVGRQKHVYDRVDDNPGNEVRQIGYRLHRFFEPAVFQLVEHESQHDRRGEGKDHLQNAEDQRVADEIPKPVGREGDIEVFPPRIHEGAAQNTVYRRIILKRQNDSVHGDVRKDQKDHEPGQKHEVERAVTPDVSPQAYHVPPAAGFALLRLRLLHTFFRLRYDFCHVFSFL